MPGPNINQADRDHLDDVGLVLDLDDDQVGSAPHAAHVEESVAR